MRARLVGLVAVLVLAAALSEAEAAGGPSVRGPSEAKPKTTVTFEVAGFPPYAQLGVVLWPTRQRNDPADHACLKRIEKEFRSDGSGEGTIGFRFPRLCKFPSGATGRLVSEFWKNGQRVDVRVFDTNDIGTYAIKAVRVVKSSGRRASRGGRVGKPDKRKWRVLR